MSTLQVCWTVQHDHCGALESVDRTSTPQQCTATTLQTVVYSTVPHTAHTSQQYTVVNTMSMGCGAQGLRTDRIHVASVQGRRCTSTSGCWSRLRGPQSPRCAPGASPTSALPLLPGDVADGACDAAPRWRGVVEWRGRPLAPRLPSCTASGAQWIN